MKPMIFFDRMLIEAKIPGLLYRVYDEASGIVASAAVPQSLIDDLMTERITTGLSKYIR